MNKDRLLEMVGFLNDLDEDKFDFSAIVGSVEEKGGRLCGTLCCAIGWLPRIFPDLVKWSGDSEDCLYSPTGRVEGFIDVAEYVFNLSTEEVAVLFIPDRTNEELDTDIPGFKLLHNNATPKEVATNILLFIKWKESQVQTKS